MCKLRTLAAGKTWFAADLYPDLERVGSPILNYVWHRIYNLEEWEDPLGVSSFDNSVPLFVYYERVSSSVSLQIRTYKNSIFSLQFMRDAVTRKAERDIIQNKKKKLRRIEPQEEDNKVGLLTQFLWFVSCMTCSRLGGLKVNQFINPSDTCLMSLATSVFSLLRDLGSCRG